MIQALKRNQHKKIRNEKDDRKSGAKSRKRRKTGKSRKTGKNAKSEKEKNLTLPGIC